MIPRVTLLTDFGTADGYAAAMAGVIARLTPAAVVEHASHEITPGDIPAAALALARYWRIYPAGTIHVVVVDPGVGTARQAIAARIDERFFVVPDNGVLTRVLREAESGGLPVRAVAIRADAVTARPVSATFHGRDLFAPAAARLAGGMPLDEIGSPAGELVSLPLPRPTRSLAADGEPGAATGAASGPASVRGEVVQVDRFGNLITDIPGAWIGPSGSRVRVGDVDIGSVRRTYGNVAEGELVALIGSLDTLEVSVRNGSAAARLGAGRGAVVTVDPEG